MTFATDIAKPGRNTAVTIAISLTAPSAKTLYLTDREGTYGGTFYEQRIVEYGTAPQKADPLTGETGLLTGSFTVQNQKLNYQAAGKTFGDILNTYVFAGVSVTMTEWNVDTGTSQAIFTGYITEIDEYTVEEIAFNVGEQYRWTTKVPTSLIEYETFPRAPEENSGKSIPMIYGQFGDYVAWGGSGPFMSGSAVPCPPAYIVDKNNVNNRFTIRCCQNDGTSAAHTATGDVLYMWVPEVNNMALLLATDHYTITNDANKTDVVFTTWPLARLPIQPIEPGPGNTAVNPMYCANRDYWKTQYSTVTDSQILSLKLPAMPDLGRVKTQTVHLWHEFVSEDEPAATLRYGLWDARTSTWIQYDDESIGFGVGDTEHSFAITAPYYDWKLVTLDVAGAEYPIEFRALLTTGKAGRTVRITLATVTCDYEPDRSILISPPSLDLSNVPEKMLKNFPGLRARGGGRYQYSGGFNFGGQYEAPYAATTTFYSNMKGQKDDGSGTFTGIASGLIYNPADIIHHAIAKYGKGVNATIDFNLTTGGSLTLGSFVQARTDLNALMTGDYELSIGLDEQMPLSAFVPEVVRHCPGLFFYRSPIDGKFQLICYQASPSAEKLYHTAFSWEKHIDKDSDFFIRETSVDEILTRVYVNYRWHAAQQKCLKTAFIGPTTSDDGYGGEYDAGEVLSAASEATYNLEHRWDDDFPWIQSNVVAATLRNNRFNRSYKPMLEAQFTTFLNAADLRIGHVISFNADVDSHVVYPKYGDTTTWASKLFQVTEIRRTFKKGRPELYTINAMEV